MAFSFLARSVLAGWKSQNVAYFGPEYLCEEVAEFRLDLYDLPPYVVVEILGDF